MILTVDILRNVVSKMEGLFIATNIEDLGDGCYKLEACDTFWLTVNCDIEIDGKIYTIKDFELNKYIIISDPNNNGIPTVDNFTVPAPFYAHGTIIETNNELLGISQDEKKFPLVYLHEKMDEEFDFDITSSIDRTSPLRLFFLANTVDTIQSEDLTLIEYHYEKVIKPLNNMRERFLNILKMYKGVQEDGIQTGRVTNHTRFANYKNDAEGYDSLLYDSILSAVEMRLTVPFWKGACEINENCN